MQASTNKYLLILNYVSDSMSYVFIVSFHLIFAKANCFQFYLSSLTMKKPRHRELKEYGASTQHLLNA